VVGVPAGEGIGVAGPKEQAPDAGNSFHGASSLGC
jgi:hypothetical protein